MIGTVSSSDTNIIGYVSKHKSFVTITHSVTTFQSFISFFLLLFSFLYHLGELSCRKPFGHEILSLCMSQISSTFLSMSYFDVYGFFSLLTFFHMAK